MARNFLLSFILTLLVAACGSNGVKLNPQYSSEAKIITAYAGIYDLRDVDQAELEKYATTQNGVMTLNVVTAAGTATGLVSPPVGFSKGGATAMSLLGALVEPTSPARKHRLLFWIPADQEAAIRRSVFADPEFVNNNKERTWLSFYLHRELFKAANSSLPAGYTVKFIYYKNKRGFEYYEPTIYDNNGTMLFVLGISMMGQNPEPAPDILGSYPALTEKHGAWLYFDTNPEDGFIHEVTPAPPFNTFTFFKQLSANLPQWAYLYITPREYVSPVPVVLHQGQELHFVKPATP